MDVIITLAGKSLRFKNHGYKLPKFLLPIGKSTVIEQVLNLFDDQDNFHFLHGYKSCHLHLKKSNVNNTITWKNVCESSASSASF